MSQHTLVAVCKQIPVPQFVAYGRFEGAELRLWVTPGRVSASSGLRNNDGADGLEGV